MAKKYILRSFSPGKKKHNKVSTLINLSALGLNAQQSLIKNSISLGASETATSFNAAGSIFPYDEDMSETPFTKYKDLTKNSSESIAYYDMSYPQRVEYLRMFAQQQTIAFVLDTIADEAIVPDENNYFALLDIDKLKTNISAGSEIGEELINTCQKAFKRVYSMFGWDRSNSAWNMFKKFLIEGYLAFEIIFDDLHDPHEIIGFKYIDPATLEPAVELDPQGREVKVWYQNRGESDEKVIPDVNLIYISWSSGQIGDGNRISYLEGLTRSYNMLAQMENSRMIWNVQNAQKRMKVVVPVGDLSPYKAQAMMNELKAEWNEETHIDDISGEIVVNGNPNFSFTKTYFFPQRTSGNMTLEEISSEGYDLSSIEPLKYFWRRFIIESKVPPNRFNLDVSSPSSSNLNNGDEAITRDEYAFSRFINRIRNIFREILLKPVWIQICLYMPKLSKSEYLKQAIGIVFNDENSFVSAKQRFSIQQGCNIINQLTALQDTQGKPVFSMKFLVEKFLNFTDDDLLLNEKYKQAEILEALDRAKLAKDHKAAQMALQQAAAGKSDGGAGPSAGGGGAPDIGSDFGSGGGDDFGAGDDDFGAGAGGDDSDFVPLSGGDMGGGGGADTGADSDTGSEDFS